MRRIKVTLFVMLITCVGLATAQERNESKQTVGNTDVPPSKSKAVSVKPADQKSVNSEITIPSLKEPEISMTLPNAQDLRERLKTTKNNDATWNQELRKSYERLGSRLQKDEDRDRAVNLLGMLRDDMQHRETIFMQCDREIKVLQSQLSEKPTAKIVERNLEAVASRANSTKKGIDLITEYWPIYTHGLQAYRERLKTYDGTVKLLIAFCDDRAAKFAHRPHYAKNYENLKKIYVAYGELAAQREGTLTTQEEQVKATFDGLRDSSIHMGDIAKLCEGTLAGSVDKHFVAMSDLMEQVARGIADVCLDLDSLATQLTSLESINPLPVPAANGNTAETSLKEVKR